MKSMKMSKKEKSESYPMAVAPESPEYPYGLCIRLQKEEMVKLGLDGLPKVGDSFMVEAKVVVKGVSMSVGESGEYASAELQITDMSMEEDGADKKSKTAKMLFGKMS